jgi:predicted RNA binding protein YcfA (HicA-like mRNA interferase family)
MTGRVFWLILGDNQFRVRRLVTMNIREVLKLLNRDGWVVERTRGSHRQLRHRAKPGTVTVSGHPSDEVHPKTLKSVLRQAGLEKE